MERGERAGNAIGSGRRLLWRLRHRLIVTYLFIAVAPVLLLAALGAFAAYSLTLQLAMDTVTGELDRRLTELSAVSGADPYFSARYPGLAIVVHSGTGAVRIPSDGDVPAAIDAPAARGIVRRGGRYFLWSFRKTKDGDVTVLAPLTRGLLDELAPQLGLVDAAARVEDLPASSVGSSGMLPKAVNVLDAPLRWFAQLPAAEWSKPGDSNGVLVVALQTRVSAVLATVFNRKADIAQGAIETILTGGVILFVAVMLACWVIGVTMTRSITGTVHNLYEATQRVRAGNFAHRMEVLGRDQLAEVGHSFNQMTESLESLVVVAKDKERLQSEVQIAQEVQRQLYPGGAVSTPGLRVAAAYRPARMVSGDYFDYGMTGDGRVALAIGDVTGKGISAALLMATLQSGLRTQLKRRVESTAAVMELLNGNLCSSSAPDKFASFCLALYDDLVGALWYANAGHLPPVWVSGGVARRLDVTGMVLGAFEGMQWEERRVHLQLGDLLVFFTDGMTEPENEFGEMFGEERFVELLAKQSHRGEQEIVDEVLRAVREWTGSDELQDDLTLLVARRV